MTNTIFIYRAKRSRNKLKYVPYKKHYNSLYDQIDIDTILEKIAGEQMSSVMCQGCLLYTSPSPRDAHESRMPSSA